MTLLKAGILGLLVAMAISSGVCETVVYQEDFSAPFGQHDWVYNNSGNNSVVGYPGRVGWAAQPWPCKIGDDGFELLGYSPSTYYATSFDSDTAGHYSFTPGQLSGQDGWVGTGTICAVRYGLAQGVRFTNESAYRNVTSGMQRSVQYVQCYVASSSVSAVAYVYAGTQDLGSIAAAVRLNDTGQIEALDGDGSGGGTWVALCNYVKIDEYTKHQTWYRITIKLDYTTHSYRAAVQGGYNDTDLGFRDSGAVSGLEAIEFVETSGNTFHVDDVYAGNSPYPPGQNLRDYWTDSYNQWCRVYRTPIKDSTYDVYDWMSCSDLSGNPVNTDTYPTDPIPGSKARPYKATLPEGWTAAFGTWADIEPQNYWASGRGKMGFTRLKGQYAQSPNDPCLHVWSSHGDLRVVSPNIGTGPGVYTLTWRGGVWNLNTADPNMQYRWTDWCSLGFGYTNWCVWDPWNANQGFLQTLPPFPKSMNWMGISEYWVWFGAPFLRCHPPITNDPPDPPDYLSGRAVAAHPAGEEPGQWHTFTKEFAFGVCPEELPSSFSESDGRRYAGPGYFIGFRVSHSHDANADAGGYQWGTILNVDDIQLAKKDPVEVDDARKIPLGTLLEVANVVITNMIFGPPDLATGDPVVRVFLEKQDRSAAIMLRAKGDVIAHIYDQNLGQFKFQRGDVVRAVGAISKDDPYDKRVPQPDTKNPVRYISSWVDGSRLPAVVAMGGHVDLKPVALNNKALAGSPVAAGLGTEGMLVTVFGKVNHSNWNYFYVDDGSGFPAGVPEPGYTNATGVRIDARGVLSDPYYMCPSDGNYAVVTGTYASEKNPIDHLTVVRVVYPRQGTDVITVAY